MLSRDGDVALARLWCIGDVVTREFPPHFRRHETSLLVVRDSPLQLSKLKIHFLDSQKDGDALAAACFNYVCPDLSQMSYQVRTGGACFQGNGREVGRRIQVG
jgi:hypothetical protein